MSVLLSGKSSHNVTPLPTAENALKLLQSSDDFDESVSSDLLNISLNQMCVTLWLDGNNEPAWYLGYCVEIDVENEEFTVEHLHRI